MRATSFSSNARGNVTMPASETWKPMSRARRAMEQLSGEQRAALELAYFGGKTSTEVAELEGIPVGTAKTRIRTALLRLRESMAEGAP